MRILQVVENSAQFPEMYKTATALKSNFGMHVALCMLNVTEKQRQKIAHQGIEIVNLGFDQVVAKIGELTQKSSTILNSRVKNRFINRIKDNRYYQKLKSYLLMRYARRTSIIYLPAYVLHLRRQLKLAEIIVKRHGPDVIVLPHIDIFGLSNSIVAAASKRNIPIVVVPYAWITRQEARHSISNLPEYCARGVLSRWIQSRWPEWIFEGRMFLPVVKILACQIVGLRITVPWMADSQAMRIALESEAMRKSYMSDGVPEDKCVITGSVTLDILGKAKDQKINPRGRPFFLVFLPPDQTGNSLSEFPYPDYWTMICAWVDACMTTENNSKPIFSIHPRMQGVLEERLMGIWPDIEIYDDDACNLIPYADFCVSELSGMMRYVLACGRPLLYFNIYKYGFFVEDFEHSQLVSRVSSRDEFISELARFKSAYISTDEAIDAHSKHWGTLDGGAARRLASLLHELGGTCGLSALNTIY